METTTAQNSDHQGKRWNHLRKILERSGPFCPPNFTASNETLEFLQNTCKILVIGKLLGWGNLIHKTNMNDSRCRGTGMRAVEGSGPDGLP